jgi:hypothetical protein
VTLSVSFPVGSRQQKSRSLKRARAHPRTAALLIGPSLDRAPKFAERFLARGTSSFVPSRVEENMIDIQYFVH